jgi:hypothetical protein
MTSLWSRMWRPVVIAMWCPALAGPVVVILLALSAAPLFAQVPISTRPAAPVLEEFDQRVKVYTDLRASVNKGAAKGNETSKPGEIAAARKTLNAKLVAGRATAKPGDIFTPAVQAHIRAILRPEMKGVKGQNARGSIWDEGPGPEAFKVTVNAEYPKEYPLGSMPPAILAALPQLPEGLEYRFVYRHLLIRDAQANLIVDFMPAALPAA